MRNENEKNVEGISAIICDSVWGVSFNYLG